MPRFAGRAFRVGLRPGHGCRHNALRNRDHSRPGRRARRRSRSGPWRDGSSHGPRPRSVSGRKLAHVVGESSRRADFAVGRPRRVPVGLATGRGLGIRGLLGRWLHARRPASRQLARHGSVPLDIRLAAVTGMNGRSSSYRILERISKEHPTENRHRHRPGCAGHPPWPRWTHPRKRLRKGSGAEGRNRSLTLRPHPSRVAARRVCPASAAPGQQRPLATIPRNSCIIYVSILNINFTQVSRADPRRQPGMLPGNEVDDRLRNRVIRGDQLHLEAIDLEIRQVASSP